MMLKKTAVVIALMLTGCASDRSIFSRAGLPAGNKLASGGEFRADLPATAAVDPQNNAMRIQNLSDQPLAGGNVWVNRRFVQQFDAIPPHGSVSLPLNEFVDRDGNPWRSVEAPAQLVTLQRDNDVYQLFPPSVQ